MFLKGPQSVRDRPPGNKTATPATVPMGGLSVPPSYVSLRTRESVSEEGERDRDGKSELVTDSQTSKQRPWGPYENIRS